MIAVLRLFSIRVQIVLSLELDEMIKQYRYMVRKYKTTQHKVPGPHRHSVIYVHNYNLLHILN